MTMMIIATTATTISSTTTTLPLPPLTLCSFKSTVGHFLVSDRTRSSGCDRMLRDWNEHCSSLINDSM
jgi:hypothetical protein